MDEDKKSIVTGGCSTPYDWSTGPSPSIYSGIFPATKPAPTPTVTISVYIDNGNVYEYTVSNEKIAREHAAAIIATGYRSVSSDDKKTLTWYPPHRIVKVKASLPYDSTTGYTDTARST